MLIIARAGEGADGGQEHELAVLVGVHHHIGIDIFGAARPFELLLPERVVAHGVRIDGAEAALGGIGRTRLEFRLRHAAQVEDLRVRQTRAGDAVEAVDLMIGAVVRVGRVGEEHEHVGS